MDWFLYDRVLRHERVKDELLYQIVNFPIQFVYKLFKNKSLSFIRILLLLSLLM